MKFLLCNIETCSIITDQQLYESVLKTMAYNARLKSNNLFQYLMVAIPYEIKYFNSEEEKNIHAFEKCIKSKTYDIYASYSLYQIFKKLENINITIISIIDSDNMNICYTDGSNLKAEKIASYGVVKLLGKSVLPEAKLDSFTNSMQLYEEYSGTVQDGTNNVGELTGIKIAVEKCGLFQVQVIISDSEYSIKAFREWIFKWAKNNYKTYAKKDIANKELIKDIKTKIDNSGKIFLFKWTKGHAGDFYNERCDELAKTILGIKK